MNYFYIIMFFKKVLFAVFPKIVVVQIISCILLLVFAIKALPANSELHTFYANWKIHSILIVSLVSSLLFLPTIIKIHFHEYNNSQFTSKAGLLFFIFLSIASPNLMMLDNVALSNFGKSKSIKNYTDALKYPSYNFFTIENPTSSDNKRMYYYITTILGKTIISSTSIYMLFKYTLNSTTQ